MPWLYGPPKDWGWGRQKKALPTQRGDVCRNNERRTQWAHKRTSGIPGSPVGGIPGGNRKPEAQQQHRHVCYIYCQEVPELSDTQSNVGEKGLDSVAWHGWCTKSMRADGWHPPFYARPPHCSLASPHEGMQLYRSTAMGEGKRRRRERGRGARASVKLPWGAMGGGNSP